MKLLRASQDQFVFHIGRREKGLLFKLLEHYPLVPAASRRLSKTETADKADDYQRQLEEALAAHRKENQRQVLALLNEPGRFQEDKAGYRFTLAPPQMEWLLQILNDVRVGSWIALGSPDTEHGVKIPLNEKTVPHLWMMEAAGHFEIGLLEAMGGE